MCYNVLFLPQITTMPLRSVRLYEAVVIEVEKNKRLTGTPIGKFFEKAATEKLNKQKNNVRLWGYLCKTLRQAGIKDNNITARKIFDHINK